MVDRENVNLLEKAYARWHETRGGSVDDWMALIDDNFQFGSLAQSAPQMAFATSYNSRSALKRYFDGLRAEWDMIHFTMTDLLRKEK